MSNIQLFTEVRGFQYLSEMVVVHPNSGDVLSEEEGGCPNLFAPLANLRVLIAFGADPSRNGRQPQDGFFFSHVMENCPALEELELGYESEFESRMTGPCGDVDFSQPVWCRPFVHALPWTRSSLRHLSLRGYVGLQPRDLIGVLFGAPPLVHLDLCGCQLLGPFPLIIWAAIAHTLVTLNVRGTGYVFDGA